MVKKHTLQNKFNKLFSLLNSYSKRYSAKSHYLENSNNYADETSLIGDLGDDIESIRGKKDYEISKKYIIDSSQIENVIAEPFTGTSKRKRINHAISVFVREGREIPTFKKFMSEYLAEPYNKINKDELIKAMEDQYRYSYNEEYLPNDLNLIISEEKDWFHPSYLDGLTCCDEDTPKDLCEIPKKACEYAKKHKLDTYF
jgi:hypothetical protein